MWHLRRFYQNEVSLENLETDFFACSSKPVESTPNKAKPSTECRENTESSVGLESSLTESQADSESSPTDSEAITLKEILSNAQRQNLQSSP